MKKNKLFWLTMMFLTACLMNLQFGVLPIQASTKFSVIQPMEKNLTLLPVSDWGEWSANNKYDGLDMRVRCEGYNEFAKKYGWNVQFKSRYQDKINFSFALSDATVRLTRTTDRTHLRSGEQSSLGFATLLNTSCGSGNYIDVYVDEVRFGENDSGPYYKP